MTALPFCGRTLNKMLRDTVSQRNATASQQQRLINCHSFSKYRPATETQAACSWKTKGMTDERFFWACPSESPGLRTCDWTKRLKHFRERADEVRRFTRIRYRQPVQNFGLTRAHVRVGHIPTKRVSLKRCRLRTNAMLEVEPQ